MNARYVDKLGINESNLANRRAFLRLDKEDRELLETLHDWAKEHAPTIAKVFYDWQFEFGPTRAFFEEHARKKGIGLAALRDALERAQTGYLLGIFEGARSNWSVDYLENRLKVGAVHDAINLPFKWYIGSYVEWQRLFSDALRESFDDSEMVRRAERALYRVFNYDMQAIADAFLFSTFESMGIDVTTVNATSGTDRTEHVNQVKDQLNVLRRQAEAIAADSLRDEVLKARVPGPLGGAFGRMVDRTERVAEQLRALSRGDLTVDLFADSGEEEVLANRLNRTTGVLRSLLGDIGKLVQAGRDGRLSERTRPEDYEGSYHELCRGINSMLEQIVSPIQEASAVLQRIATKDFTVRVQGDYRGDHAVIRDSLNQTIDVLESSLAQVARSAEQLRMASTQISSGSQSLSQSTYEQASSLEEISSTVEELSAMTQQNASNAGQAKSMSEGSQTAAGDGMTAMTRLSEAISLIKGSSDRTAKIVKTIDEIAFQTNLLALNAAVEAARAGDAGKGFAVVAEEVRSLAQRSAEAAKNTSELIEESVRNADAGVRLGDDVARQLDEIVNRSTKVNEMVAEIAAASSEQSKGLGMMNSAIGQLNQVTQQNAASSEQSASAAEELAAQSGELTQMVGQFRLRPAGSVGFGMMPPGGGYAPVGYAPPWGPPPAPAGYGAPNMWQQPAPPAPLMRPQPGSRGDYSPGVTGPHGGWGAPPAPPAHHGANGAHHGSHGHNGANGHGHKKANGSFHPERVIPLTDAEIKDF
ncbi:MAG: methyl-accepting chemotaxis protein [Polyangiaceae bacterium]